MGAFRCRKQVLKLEGDVDEMLGSTIELKKRPKTQTDWITPPTIAS
jgi:hypothetical protein